MTETLPSLLPEWTPHAALWVGWPRLREEWVGDLEGPRADIAAFIREASRFVKIRVAAGSDEARRSAEAALGDRAEICEIPTGDIWLRDTGPIITGEGKARAAQVFRFNGWGGKYQMPGDEATAAAVAKWEGLPTAFHDFVLEGGAIDVDGAGRMLTTRQCLLNSNRNPGLSEDEIGSKLKTSLGVDTVIWLEDGLLNDHTDGHVDNIARFVGPGLAVAQHAAGPDDPNAETYETIELAIRHAGVEVITIPSPGRINDADGNPVPASHMNFAITNGAVFLPVYEDRFSLVAQAELKALMPDHEIIALPARHILDGGGSFHCMTREIPV